ncbi:MAG: hypothetical protein QOJ38_560 [Solirubrobacterales bacterium]|jgi:glycosyltransferase involved in cell wall biosynthesis|nr:hypothetical protein [Solirubrobacterales bacterium]
MTRSDQRRQGGEGLRVAVYTDYAYHRVGEAVYAERAFALFLAALAERSERLVLAGRLAPGAERGRYPIGERIEFVALPYYERLTHPLSAIRGMLGSLRRLWRTLDDVDVAWLLGPHPLAVAFAVLARLRRRRVVLGVRQDTPSYVRNRHPRRPLLWAVAWALDAAYRLLGRFSAVVVVGPALAARYRPSRALLEIAVSLVSESEIVPADVAGARSYAGELTALSVGRLDAEKNPALLADVLAELDGDEPGWRLLVCGEGPLEADLRGALERRGVAERAELRGYVPLDAGLRELYASSHAFLHVSWTEGLPQVVFEAFAAGLPVVATDVGGIAGAVGDAVLLVPAGDASAAAGGLRRIAGDGELRGRLVAAGFELVRSRTIESETAAVADFLEGRG